VVWLRQTKQNQVSLYRLNEAAPAARSGYTRSVFKPSGEAFVMARFSSGLVLGVTKAAEVKREVKPA